MQHLPPPVRFPHSDAWSPNLHGSPCIGDCVAVSSSLLASFCNERPDAPPLRGLPVSAYPAAPVPAPGAALAQKSFPSHQRDQRSLASWHDAEAPIHRPSEPMQCEEQHVSPCWPGMLHQDDCSLLAVSASVAVQEPIAVGTATATAEYAAAIAAILDSFGGPISSTGWNRLARNCYASNGEITSQTAQPSTSASSHQVTAQELEWFSQQSQQAHAFMSDCGTSDDSIIHLGTSSHTHHAAPSDSQRGCALPIFNHLPSHQLPSALPIWSLDIPSYHNTQNVPDTYISPAPHPASNGPAQPTSMPWWQPHEQELSLPLSVLPSMPASNAQVVIASSSSETAAAAAAAAIAPSAAAGAQDADSTKAKKKKVKRARILKEGSLTLIPYGMNERLRWAQQISQFTQQVRSVLGNRSLSKPWSGSVLDSVIGTFLTQNVSDQLSSKAYMTLAATFPPKAATPSAAVSATPSTAASAAPSAASSATPVTPPSTASAIASASASDWVSASSTASAAAEIVMSHQPQVQSASAVESDGSPQSLSGTGRVTQGLSRASASGQLDSGSVDLKNSSPDSPRSSSTMAPQNFKNVAPGGDLAGLGAVLPFEGAAESNDSVDWQAVRLAPTAKVAEAIQCRGMHNRLADSIQGFLNRLHSSALANQQRLDSTAPLSEALAPTPAASPAVPSGTPADPFWQAALDPEPVHMSRKPQAASPPRKQVLAHSTTPGKVLSEADADETASQQCPTAAAAAADAAAPVCIEDTCVGTDSVPLLGITSSASHVTAAAVVAEDASAANDAAAVAKDRAPHDQHSRTADCDMEDAAVSDIKLSLEWLRSAPPQVASAFLLSVEGLGRKSVACIMLLCLRMREFPVDVNVGRICSRLGWIPLDVESASQVDEYAPETEVHKYLHSRLAPFDVASLYELHYQMITLGKVFCSKVSPNCGACPLQSSCEYALGNGKKFQPQAASPRPAEQKVQSDLDSQADGVASSAPPVAKASSDIEDLVLDIPALKVLPHSVSPLRGSQALKETHAAVAPVPPPASASILSPSSAPASSHVSAFVSAPVSEPGGSAYVSAPVSEPVLPASAPVPRPVSAPYYSPSASTATTQSVSAGAPANSICKAPAPVSMSSTSTQLQQPASLNPACHEQPGQHAGLQNDALDSSAGPACQSNTAFTQATHCAEPHPFQAADWDLPDTSTDPDARCSSDFSSQKRSKLNSTAAVAGDAVGAEQLIEKLLEAGRLMNDLNREDSAAHQHQPLRLAAAAAEALGLDASIARDNAGDAATHARKRVRELSMLVHPDKCSLIGAEEAFAALQQAYSILQRQHCSSAPASMSHHEAEQAAMSQHNRLLLQALEIPPSCWYLLPPHLRATAHSSPCDKPFLALLLDAVRLQLHSRPPLGSSPSAAVVHASSSSDHALTAGSACTDASACGQHVPVRKAATSDAVLDSSSVEICCSAGTACTACAGSDNTMLASDHLAKATDSPACSAGIAGSSSPASNLCTAGNSQGSNAASTGHLENELNPSSWQKRWHNPGQEPGNSQGHFPSQGQGHRQEQEQGQRQDVVPMALLVPCRKAMRDRFPLNGTFFQVNEVFLDSNTVECPLQVPRHLLGSWGGRGVYTGVQAASICRGMRQGEVAHLFNQASICVRAYNSTSGMPNALPPWLLPSMPVSKPRMRPPHSTKGAPQAKKQKFAAGTDTHTDPPLHDTQGVPAGHAQAGSRQTPVQHHTPAPALAEAGLSGMPSPSKTAASGRPTAAQDTTLFPRQVFADAVGSEHVPKIPEQPAVKANASIQKSRKRVQSYENVRASQRCGCCKTCLNPSMKKACITRRAEMDAVKVVVTVM